MEHKVFILILNWNGGNDTIECLKSLKNINYSNYEIIVIDNCSTDNSVNLIRQGFPEIKIILNHSNLGFAEGMNTGIREVMAKAPKNEDYYILLLNQDVVVRPDFLTKLVTKAKSNVKIGILGPKIYYYRGAENMKPLGLVSSSLRDKNTEEIIWSCGAEFISGRAFRIKIPYFNSALIGCGEVDKGQYDNAPIDSLPGCCMLIRPKVINEIGLLDSEFFLLHEDDDLCIRAQKAGYEICLVPDSVIWHKVSTSLLNSVQYYTSNPIVTYYWNRNWFFVLAKHFSKKVFFRVLLSYVLRVIPFEVWKLFWSGGAASIFIIMAVVIYGGGFAGVVRGKSVSFITLSTCFLLITLILYLNEIYKALTDKTTIEKIKQKPPFIPQIPISSYFRAFIDALKYIMSQNTRSEKAEIKKT